MYVRTSRYRLTPEGLADLKSGIREQMMGPITAAPGNRLFAVMTSPDDEQNGLFVSAWESKEDCDHFESEVRPTLYARWKGGFDGPFEVNYWETRWPGTLQINENSLANPSPMYVRTSRFKLHDGQVETVAGHYREEVMAPWWQPPGTALYASSFRPRKTGSAPRSRAGTPRRTGSASSGKSTPTTSRTSGTSSRSSPPPPSGT